MRKSLLILALFLVFLASACSPAASWPLEIQTSVDAASLEGVPEDMEGTITCDLIYNPGETLSMTLYNGTNQSIITGGEGVLYRQNDIGLWYKVGNKAWMDAPAYIYAPEGGGSFCALGLEDAPTLESGEYQFVLGASCGRVHFELTVPFTVP